MTGYAHIRIDPQGAAPGAAPDACPADEVIDVGVLPPRTRPADAAGEGAGQPRGGAPAQAASPAPAKRPASDEMPDYSVEDAPPMPLGQKLIIVAAACAVAYALARIVMYWVGA